MLLNVTIPVLNEERRLPACMDRLLPFLQSHSPCPYEVIIADNGSTDSTLGIARSFAASSSPIRVIHLSTRGRGRAIREAWLGSDAGVLSYMDVDLSSDLEAFPLLINAIVKDGFDLAVGSRLLMPNRTRRTLKRELISRGYNRLVRFALSTKCSDAQCGFKAIKQNVARALLPRVKDCGWFFDTELLVLAEREGFRIHDLPVAWIENRDTRVKLLSTVWHDLLGIWRLRQTRSGHL